MSENACPNDKLNRVTNIWQDVKSHGKENEKCCIMCLLYIVIAILLNSHDNSQNEGEARVDTKVMT